MPSGLPKTSISVGEYDVGYVRSTDFVDILVYESGQDSKVPFMYYRFPKEAFDSNINIEATRGCL